MKIISSSHELNALPLLLFFRALIYFFRNQNLSAFDHSIVLIQLPNQIILLVLIQNLLVFALHLFFQRFVNEIALLVNLVFSLIPIIGPLALSRQERPVVPGQLVQMPFQLEWQFDQNYLLVLEVVDVNVEKVKDVLLLIFVLN